MTTPTKEQIHKFLSKGLDLAIKTNQENTHIDLWFYQMVTEQLKIALASPDNIIYLQDKAELADVNVKDRDAALVVYDSGEAPSFMPDAPHICIYKRLICLALVECERHDFVGSAPFQLGIDVNRHTLETYKGRATHFILPFDVLLYVESEKLHYHGAPALDTNLFNQDGFLFSPHIIPSIVTGFLTKGDLSNLAAFVAQPKMLRKLCETEGITVNSKLDNADINDDVLLSLKVLEYRYFLPINRKNVSDIEEFDAALERADPQISVKIAGTNVHIVKPPPKADDEMDLHEKIDEYTEYTEVAQPNETKH